jgi:hypothetical protein
MDAIAFVAGSAADDAVAIDAVANHGAQRAAKDAAQQLGTARRQHVAKRTARPPMIRPVVPSLRRQ